MKKIVVIGAGAVGGYFGARLAKAGVPVTFLVRQNRFKLLAEKGLHIKSIHGDVSIQPDLAVSAKEIQRPDAVIIAVKNYHLAALLPELDALVNQGAKLLPLLNGAAHMELLQQRYGSENVLGGLCYIESTLDHDGNIVQTSPMHEIVFGPAGGVNDQWAKELEETLSLGDFPVQKSENILMEMWQKFIFLVSLSGITSCLRRPIGIALEDTKTRAFLEDMVHEAAALGKLLEPSLPEDTAEQVMKKLESISPAMTSSMHRDLEKGLHLELESLQGYIVQKAEELGISAPSFKAVLALLHPFRNGEFSAD